MFKIGGLKMNLKRLSIILFVFLTLMVSISVISAADSEVAELQAPTEEIDESVLSNETQVVDESQKVVNSDVKETTKASTPTKIKTKVEADQVAVKYNKKGIFKIKVEDRRYDDYPVSHAKLKVKIGTGSKAKTFNVNTNYNGVAKINTKSLKTGAHNVVISSDDDRYEIYKTSKVFVGKHYKKTIKATAKKAKLKKGDVIKLKSYKDDDDREVKVIYKKAKHTKILKVKFYLKNKSNGKTVVKTDKAEFDDGRWELPEEDYSYNRFSLVKVKVYYIAY